MPSEYSPADSGRGVQAFPRIVERIGENPARFLDRDLTTSTPEGHAKPSLMLEARIDGIDFVDVAIAYLAVETQLDREECPRSGVIDRLEARKEWLQDHGDRPRGSRVAPEDVPSTDRVGPGRVDTDDGEHPGTYSSVTKRQQRRRGEKA
jgi:hypothetical protein